MDVGRNQSCPCGSGRKYKRCCEPLDREVGLLFRVSAGEVPGAPSRAEIAEAAGSEPWEADVIRGIAGSGSAAGAPGMTLVLGGGHVLCLEALERAPEDPERRVALLERALRVAIRSAGLEPPGVLVRTEDLAARLRGARSPGAPISASAELPEVDRFAEGAAEHFQGVAAPPPAEAHETWRRWGWPSGVVAELFRAAAEFWRAAPWRVVDTAQPLSLRTTTGSTWTACVLGNGGIEFGLVLYRDPDDLRRQMLAGEPDGALEALRGPVLSLSYGPRTELARPAAKEILAAGWEVADREAYPELIALNPPAGGVSPEWAEELAGALWSVPRFVKQHRHLLEDELNPLEPVRWVDPASAIELSYAGRSPEDEPLWEVPEVLAPALPSGPAADPAAALLDPDLDRLHEQTGAVVEGFRARLTRDGVPAAELERCVRDVTLLLDGLTDAQGVPLAACTELDLRLVLYDWLPRRSGATESEARDLPASVERFLAHLAEAGLEFPWAGPVLRDREAFEIRLGSAPGGPWWDEEVADWRAEVYDDLDARLLLPDAAMAEGGIWGPMMGPVEAALSRELGRRWLLWRDQVIAGGERDPEAVREMLSARQREWELAGHPRHGGRSPVEVIAEERSATARPAPTSSGSRRAKRK